MVSLEPAVISALEQFSTPSILNGLKRLGVATGNLQTMSRHAVACTSPDLGARAGLAVTRVVATRRDGSAPDLRRTSELDVRSAATVAALTAPAFAVVQNVGDWEGPVCVWGEIMAHIQIASGYRAGVTNGPVRDVIEMRDAGFQTFSGGVDVGGGFVDHVDVDVVVEIGGLTISPGDLLHGDRHGVIKIPIELAADLPAAIEAHEAVEARVIAVCRSDDFSLDAVANAFAGTDGHT